jgi:hypothetical protein
LILLGLVHIAVSALLALALSLAYGHLTAFIAGFSLVIGWLAGLSARSRLQKGAPEFRWNSWNPGIDGWLEKIIFAFVIYICVRHFSFLFYLSGSSWKSLDVSNYGDLPLHINYIRAMSLKNPFPLVDPSYSHDLLRYPYGIDLYNALWDILGVPLSSHLFLVGMFGSVATLVSLRAKASWWAVTGFFLSGGWLGWMSEPAMLAEQVQWKNLFLTVFVTQRGFLFALPVGLLILKQLSGEVPLKKVATFWTGLLWGALAFFHLHAFLIVSLMAFGLAIWRKNGAPALKAMKVAVPLATGFILFSTHFLSRASVVHFESGWTHKGPESIFSFLNFNFGPYLDLYLILALLLVASLLKKKKEARPLLFLFAFYTFWFALFFNVMVAPWAWDNIKVLIWPYLGLLSVAWLFFKNQLHPVLKVAVFVVLAWTGFWQLAPTLTSTVGAQTLFEVEKLANCEGATRALPRSAVFIASGSHLHPLNYFGRIRALGYAGHLWSHGIDSHLEDTLQARILNDDPQWRDLAHQLGAQYIYWGPDEQQAFGSKKRSWQESLKNISPVESIQVYEVN